MVIAIQIPETIPWNPLIRKRFLPSIIHKKFNKRFVPFERYIDVYRASSLLGITPGRMVHDLHRGYTHHAINLNGKLHIHPDSIMESIRGKVRKLISKELGNFKKVFS